MFGFQLAEFDKKVYQEESNDFLPKYIVDTHTHVYLEVYLKTVTISTLFLVGYTVT